MPIVRTYACPNCNHFLEVTLAADDWDAPAPVCPACEARAMNQEFAPPRINGSPYARANAIAEKIAAEDYHVENMNLDQYRGGPRREATPKVAYKDLMEGVPKRQGRDWVNNSQSTWGASGEAMMLAQANGRRMRRQFGDGLDVLKSVLDTGAQPDLLAASKRRAMRIY